MTTPRGMARKRLAPGIGRHLLLRWSGMRVRRHVRSRTLVVARRKEAKMTTDLSQLIERIEKSEGAAFALASQ